MKEQQLWQIYNPPQSAGSVDSHRARPGKKTQVWLSGSSKFYLTWASKNEGLVVRLPSEISFDVVLLGIIFDQKQFQNLRLQDEQNNTSKLKARTSFKSKHTLPTFVLCYSL